MNKLSRKTNKVSPKIFLHFIEPQIKIEDFNFFDVSKLDKIKESSLQEVIIQDLLEYFTDAEFVAILSKIVSKLKRGGKLHIQGIDAHSLCCGVAYSQIDMLAFKAMLFSTNKNNIFSITQIKQTIENQITNIEINKIKFLNGLQYYIECFKK
jgi:hypothetical protein